MAPFEVTCQVFILWFTTLGYFKYEVVMELSYGEYHYKMNYIEGSQHYEAGEAI